MSKTKTSGSKKNHMTPKQAVIAGGVILRGIDNAILSSKKRISDLEALKAKTKVLAAGIAGLSNSGPVRTVPKASLKTVPVKSPKTPVMATKAPAKKAPKPVQKNSPKPVQKADPITKVEKTAKVDPSQKKPVAGRPTLREAVKEFLPSSPTISRADLYEKVVEKYGYWSKQSFYILLSKDPEIKIEDGKPFLPKVDDKDLDLVRKVERDQATANVV